jgi:hypothetical protein
MKLITTSPNIAALDSQIIFDLCAGKIYVDVSPSSYIGSGVLNVLGASVKITNPYGVVVKDYPASGYDIEDGSPPLEEVVEVNIPTLAGNYQYGTYTVAVKMIDANGDEYEEIKSINICEPDSSNKQRNYGSLSARLKGICKEGRLYVVVDTPPNYRGNIVESQENDFTLEYPTSSGLDPVLTSVGSFAAPLFEGVYKMTGTICATYNYGNNVYAKINYKVKAKKEIFCIIDECCIFTRLGDLHSQLGTDCTDEEKAVTANTVLDALRLLKTIELAAECGDDPSDYVADLEKLLGCKCTCHCNDGTPIIPSSTASSLVSIEGCNVTKQVVGLTDVYTINNYEYKVSVDPNGGMLYVASETLAECSITSRLVFDIVKVYGGVKTLADANVGEAGFWANVVNKSLIDLNPDCLGITTAEWNELSLKRKIERIITKLCSCCGCDGVVVDVTETRDGADYIITFDLENSYTADVYLDGVIQSNVLYQNAPIEVRMIGAADGATHIYTIIPRCSNGQMGTPYSGEFRYIACPQIEPPQLLAAINAPVDCPYNLSGAIGALPSGITAEWHTADNTEAATLVADPTAVNSGVYYAFAKDESTGCYSMGLKVIIVCVSESECTAPQNLEVMAITGGFLVQFQSAAFPPPFNSYTVKRRLAIDPDVDGSYTTIGTPTWNASSARWEILDSTALNSTLYVYEAQSNCGDDTTPSVQYQFANIICARITLTTIEDEVNYTFEPPVGTQIDKYEISIIIADTGEVVDLDTHIPAFPSEISGTFNYLEAATTYKVRARVFIGDYYRDCAWTAITTDEATGEVNVVVTNNHEGGIITAVNPAFFSVTDGSFPLNFPLSVQGNQDGGTFVIDVVIDSNGAVDGTVKLYKNGVLVECINVPTGTADTYTFASVDLLSSDLVEIIYEIGAC